MRLTLTQAIAELEAGRSVWCQPKGYRGWWVSFANGNLYDECGGAWYRCKKGVSTILGADWHTTDPECGGSPPEHTPAHYESPSFLAHEVNSAEKAVISGFKDIRDELAALRREIKALAPDGDKS